MTPDRFHELRQLATTAQHGKLGREYDLGAALHEALDALQKEDIENCRLRSALRTVLGEP